MFLIHDLAFFFMDISGKSSSVTRGEIYWHRVSTTMGILLEKNSSLTRGKKWKVTDNGTSVLSHHWKALK